MSAGAVRPGARAWALAALLLGLGASIAANVAHAYVGTASPSVGAVVASVVWPVLVLVAVELLTRTPWPAGRPWALVRWGGVGLVAVVAALVSYRHLAGLLAAYGEDAVVVAVGPLAVDGLAVMATAALLAAGTPAAPAEDVDPVELVDPVVELVEAPDYDDVALEVEPVVEAAPVRYERLRYVGPAVDPVVELDVEDVAPVVEPVAPVVEPVVPVVEPVVEVESGWPATTSTGRVVTAAMRERADRVAAAIRSGELAPAPSERVVREWLGGGSAEVARGVRDLVAGIPAGPMPGQASLALALPTPDAASAAA